MKTRLKNKITLAAFSAFAVLAGLSGITNITVKAADNSAANANISSVSLALPSSTPGKNTPDALVADLYKQHNAKKSPFFQTKSRALVDKYFTKATANLIWKDAITVKGEVGALDGDPLYNAQDMEIKNFKIGKADVNNNKADVPVTFENFGEKKTITYSLVSEKGIWKIENIKYEDGYTLVGLYKEDNSK